MDLCSASEIPTNPKPLYACGSWWSKMGGSKYSPATQPVWSSHSRSPPQGAQPRCWGWPWEWVRPFFWNWSSSAHRYWTSAQFTCWGTSPPLSHTLKPFEFCPCPPAHSQQKLFTIVFWVFRPAGHSLPGWMITSKWIYDLSISISLWLLLLHHDWTLSVFVYSFGGSPILS